MEHWINIPSYPNYQASIDGRIRNAQTGHVLKPFADRYGYLRLSLGNTDNVYVHRLIAETFYGYPNGERTHVNHIDADRQNNHVFNLEYCTPRENVKWGVVKGNVNPFVGLARAKEVNQRPVRVPEINKEFNSIKECAEFLGVKPTNLSRCLTGSRRGQKLHGYHIEFTEVED